MIRILPMTGVALIVSAATGYAQTPAARSPIPGAPPGVTAFVNVAVVPMDTERVLTNHTVLIQHGRITALGPSGEVSVPAGATRIDGRGQYLIPGLADMHVHLMGGGVLAGPNDSASVEHQLFQWLGDGITTVRNMDWMQLAEEDERTLRLKARAAAGALWSPRIYTSGSLLSSIAWKSGDPPKEMARYVAAYKAKGYDFLKIHHGESAEGFDSIAAAARRFGVPILGHAPLDIPPGSTELERAFAAGYRSIEHLTGYYQYLYRQHVHPELPEPLVKNGRRTPWTAAQLAQMRRTDDPLGNPAFAEALRQQLDAAQPTIAALATRTQQAGVWNTPTLAVIARLTGIDMTMFNRLVKRLQEAGAGLLLGTDAPIGAQAYKELEALVAAGLTPYQALVTGTRNPASYFGTLDQTGTIAVGKRADLALLTGNPLADIGNVKQPASVMLGGRWLTREAINQRLASIKAPAGD